MDNQVGQYTLHACYRIPRSRYLPHDQTDIPPGTAGDGTAQTALTNTRIKYWFYAAIQFTRLC